MLKKFIIGIILTIVLVFFFWPGYPPYQFITSFIPGGKQLPVESNSQLKNHKIPAIVDIKIQSSVVKEDADKIREGIRLMDYYLNKWFGHSVKNHVLITVDDSTRESKFEEIGGEMVAALHTNEPLWQQFRQFITQYNMDMRSRFSAHEYVHYYQRDFGCGRIYKPEEVKLKWLMEGQAEWLSWKAMDEAGEISLFLGLEQMLAAEAKQSGENLQPLSAYEIEANATIGRYVYFALATDYLMRGKDIKALDKFCSNVGKGQDGPTAFQNAFNLPLEKFYSDFETYYKTLIKK